MLTVLDGPKSFETWLTTQDQAIQDLWARYVAADRAYQQAQAGLHLRIQLAKNMFNYAYGDPPWHRRPSVRQAGAYSTQARQELEGMYPIRDAIQKAYGWYQLTYPTKYLVRADNGGE